MLNHVRNWEGLGGVNRVGTKGWRLSKGRKPYLSRGGRRVGYPERPLGRSSDARRRAVSVRSRSHCWPENQPTNNTWHRESSQTILDPWAMSVTVGLVAKQREH